MSVLFIIACKKENNTADTLPVLQNPVKSDVSNITDTSATVNASVSSEGGSSIIAKGVCWSTNHNPNITDYKTTNRLGSSIPNNTTNGIGSESFTATLTGLSPHTTYYFRVYATNNNGTGYSDEGTIITSTVTDIDDNIYETVTIGTQVWMAENLKTTRYNDGSAIPIGLTDSAWQHASTGAYAVYNNEVSNNTTFGKLYNWYAVNTGKLAPTGWHVPTDAEWTTLITYLGGEEVAGGHMKSTSSLWNTPNTSADNSSGFSGLPGGYRTANGFYFLSGTIGQWWSSTQNSSGDAWMRYLYHSSNSATRTINGKVNGFSVRCVKD